MRRPACPSSSPLAIVRAASIALVAAAAVTTGALADESPCGAPLAAETVVRLLNEVRAHGRQCGPDASMAVGTGLVWNETLANAALVQSNEMARLRRMGHRDGANRDLADRLRAQGYRFASALENVAVGYGSLDAVVEAWLDSVGHCRNLMSAAVFELGIACVDGAGPGSPEERRYWTLVLAAPPTGANETRQSLDGLVTARRDPSKTP